MVKISEHELAFYRKHPELVQAFGDKATIHRVVLVTAFLIGFLLVAVSKAVKYGVVDAPAPLAELTVDLIFELGVALWGGVATTVLLQNFVERRYREGRRYQQEIMSRLAKDLSQDGAGESGSSPTLSSEENHED
jgi:hypothetical protein